MVESHAAAVRLALAGGALGGVRRGCWCLCGPWGFASVADARPGFARLVRRGGLDHVCIGGVLGIEMSRLARSGREWHQLLELSRCRGGAAGRPGGVL